jgi:uncharacterized protein
MGIGRWVLGASALGVGALVYGGLVETRKLKVERRALRLPFWPSEMDGFKVALLADLHVRDHASVRMAQWAVDLALEAEPDMIVVPGDVIAYWRKGLLDMVEAALAGLKQAAGRVVMVPGNHDHYAGDPEWFRPVFDQFGIRMLRNETWIAEGVNWIGIDSVLAGCAEPYRAIRQSDPTKPMVIVWHEPDAVDALPAGPDLMVSGHSHGGQFLAPWGWAPGTSELGKKYIRGWYPRAPVPLYVSRGVGTTGPPSRLFCPAEVSILTLHG